MGVGVLWEFGVQAEADLSIRQRSRKLEGALCSYCRLGRPSLERQGGKKMAGCTAGSGADGSRGVLWG